MKYLKEHPAFDYFVLRSNHTNGETYASLAWGDPIVGVSFRKHRDNAMLSGDRFSAALICNCVLWDIEFCLKVADFQRERVVDQFSREYKIPMATLQLVLEVMGNFRGSTHNQLPLVYYNSPIFCMLLMFFLSFFFEQNFGSYAQQSWCSCSPVLTLRSSLLISRCSIRNST